ncbi:DUF642 domain-containing protein [Thalassotalea sp. LPB0316]|uniref:PEP-CTERM sorting domain-containing protein n=1 Tax=Thalassotalea sp. LPB0316 TaxID=2769490 RepID=UPI0018665A37|nr:PEP-CTERM sorting domain-containing protein [Thalassotalea sp. LPB0316]QOL25604.1 DUF642 domain-containing protein [Thalassotalea sp. LPB0316]
MKNKLMSMWLMKLSLASFLFFTAHYASASLIVNGSFEQVVFDDNTSSKGNVFGTDLAAFANKNKGWDVFMTLPGWFTSGGNGIEIQKNIVTKSQDGSQHVELDSHKVGQSNSMMTQTVDSLIVGQMYQLDYYYKPRTNNIDDNGINVYWYGSNTLFNDGIQAQHTSDGTRNTQTAWQLETITFEALESSMNLSFAAVGSQNTLGGLIDNVSLVQVAQVPEPSTLLLLLFPAGMLLVKRKTA